MKPISARLRRARQCILEPWHHRVGHPLVGSDVVASISHGSDLVRHFGRWPSFEDAELVSLQFQRGNHMAVVESGDWGRRISPALDATFSVFDAEAHPESSERRPAEVTLRFSELHEVHIEGLGYQNPIQGLGIRHERLEPSGLTGFRVDWGGTGMGHEVSLLCTTIAVRSIVPRPQR